MWWVVGTMTDTRLGRWMRAILRIAEGEFFFSRFPFDLKTCGVLCCCAQRVLQFERA